MPITIRAGSRLSKIKSAFIKKEQTEQEVRGDMSEKRFEDMVEGLAKNGKLPWFRGLARASATEDWILKIDFRMRVVSEGEEGTMEFSIPFQIKSSTRGAEDFKKANPRSKAHVIIMNVQMREAWLLNILTAAYLSEAEKHNHPAPVK